MRTAKEKGYADRQIAHLLRCLESTVYEKRNELGIRRVYKLVDTCAAEFEAQTPYYYSTFQAENESVPSDRKKIVVLGSGPNRIGQGIEFDYCCVHGVLAAKECGYETIMINCNPETVSTDFDIAGQTLLRAGVLGTHLRHHPTGAARGCDCATGWTNALKLLKSWIATGSRSSVPTIPRSTWPKTGPLLYAVEGKRHSLS